MSAAPVLVIGGGFAGCAAAATLAAGGARVVLLDERSALGGRARTDHLDGVSVDTGAQFIATSFSRTLGLLGGTARALPSGLHRTAGRDLYLLDGVRHPVQFGSMRSLLRFGGLRAGEKLRLARTLLPLLAANRDRLDAGAEAVPAALDAVSAREFVAARAGARAADVLVDPPLHAFYAMRGDEASAAFFLSLARYGTDGDLVAPEDGWSPLLERATIATERISDVHVAALDMEADRVTVHAADGRHWNGEAVIVATGPAAAHALLPPRLPEIAALREWLASVELRATWTVAMIIDRPLPTAAFGLFPDPRVARWVSACAIQGANRAGPPRSAEVLLAWPTPDGADALRTVEPPAIVAAMRPEIEMLVPEAREHVRRARVYRHEGSPVARTGFAADRARGRALADAVAAPLALAGDYLTTPTIEGAVASGIRAADRLLRQRRQALR